MSERRGPQGVQGVQGIEGIEGQGTPGAQGAQGERGERGKMLPRNVTLSFVVVVMLAFLILSVLAWQMRETRSLARENEALVTQECQRQQKTIVLLRLFLKEGSRQFEIRPVTEEDRLALIQFQRKTNVLLDEADCKQPPGSG